MITAEVICDSVSDDNIRLTTLRLRYPKFIHGELMTHRVFSRNASSSRAIPTAKLIEEVRSDALRAVPVFWGKNQKGMQAAEELDDEYIDSIHRMTNREWAQHLWESAALQAAAHAESMFNAGVHKQIVNRVLEPFSHINVLVTATEWDNFFGLRLHPDAQPEMRALAIAMWEARRASKPGNCPVRCWHLPFCTLEDPEVKEIDQPIVRRFAKNHNTSSLEVAKRVSVARCARVSYQSFETGRRSTVEEDLLLYDKLISAQPFHASPAEHQATPDAVGSNEYHTGIYQNPNQHGNFRGWRQYRKMLPDEAVAPLPEGYR